MQRGNVPLRALSRFVEGESTLSSKSEKLARFESVILPHLDAAHNLARWLLHHDQDAEDVVQEAFLRAYRYFDAFQGGTGRAWLLKIVRNSCYTWIENNRPHQDALPLDEEGRDVATDLADPAAELLLESNREMVECALSELPAELREAIVLREIEELTYKEIAAVIEAPIGTVMSRLARGRKQLYQLLRKGFPGLVADGSAP